MKTQTIALLVFLMVFGCWILPAHGVTLRSADTHPEDYPTVQAVKYMGKLLAERSSGRLTVEVFHSRQLGEEKETVDQCRAGGLDIVRLNAAPLTDTVPEAVIPALPFIFRSQEHMYKVLDSAIGEEILKSFEKADLIGLAYYDSGARCFYNTKRKITKLDDLKGLRIRVQQSAMFKAMVESLGAVAVPMPFGEVLDALRVGIIDGAENNIPSYHSTEHYTVAKNFTLDGHAMTPEILVFSKKSWTRLSEEDQKLIRQAAKESGAHMRQLWRERELSARKKIEEAGVTIIDNIDKEPFINAVQPIYTQFVKTPELKALITRIQEVK